MILGENTRLGQERHNYHVSVSIAVANIDNRTRPGHQLTDNNHLLVNLSLSSIQTLQSASCRLETAWILTTRHMMDLTVILSLTVVMHSMRVSRPGEPVTFLFMVFAIVVIS